MHLYSSLVQDQGLPLRFVPHLNPPPMIHTLTVSYSFLEGHHQLRVWLSHPTKEQVEALLKIPFEIAMVVQKEFLILLCRFGNAPWMMASFQWHHVPVEKRVRPDLWTPARLEILFLDGETDQGLATRIVVCGPEFTSSLCGAILIQASTRWHGEAAYEDALHRFLQKHPCATALVPLATARTLDTP